MFRSTSSHSAIGIFSASSALTWYSLLTALISSFLLLIWCLHPYATNTERAESSRNNCPVSSSDSGYKLVVIEGYVNELYPFSFNISY